jgi:uncharacterized protein YigA (DUF484 family)
MNEQPIREAQTDGLPEDAVADYLLANPDFFERHGNLLARLKLPHHRDSAAISLHERQLHVLREKHAALEGKLRELIENARANQVVVDRVHRLTLRLLGNRDARGVLAAVDASLREDFGASNWVLLITDPSLQELAGTGFPQLRVVSRDAPELRVFATFFESGRPRSGHIRENQRDYLFGADGAQVGSTVLLPIGDRASLGLLAIASQDSERYKPTMSTDFLTRIGELLTEAITARAA